MISFIVPTYNREDTIERCIRSIYSVKCDKEVIVIDDNSNDKTIEIIKRNFPKVNIIRNKSNKGPAYARNVGIKEANGEYLFFVDSDVFLTKDILKKLLKYEDHDILFPRIIFEDNTQMYPSNSNEERYLKASTVFMIRKNSLIENNLFFDELYFIYDEDTDFFLRCKLNNLKCKYVREAIAMHALQSKVSLNLEKRYYLTTKNHIYSYFKYLFLDKNNRELFDFPRFKLIIKDILMALFNINLLSFASVEGRTKIKRNKINVLFNTRRLTNRSRIVLIYLFKKAVLWNIFHSHKIIKNMLSIKELKRYNLVIYTTGLMDFYYWNIYRLKKSKNIEIERISSRFLYNTLIKLNNHSKLFRIIRKKFTGKSNVIEGEPSVKNIVDGILAPVKLIFRKNIILSFPAYSNMIYYMFFLNLLGKNTIYFTSWPYWNTKKYETRPLFNRWIWHQFLKRTKIVAVSKTAYNTLKLKKYNVVQIPHSVDVDSYNVKNKNNKKIKLLYTGRLVEEKGIRDILEVSSKFDRNKVEFLFAGDGQLVDLIKAKEKSLPVKYIGYIESKKELKKLYSQSDIFILNSYSLKTWEEWFGISLIEAMASGLAVVSTDCIGPKEIINKNKVGFLIKQKDKQELYNKLKILIDNITLRNKFGINARKLVMNEYNLEDNSKKWWKILIN